MEGFAGFLADTIQDESLEIILLSDRRYDRSHTGRETRQIREFGEYCRKKKIPIEDLCADAILQDERS